MKLIIVINGKGGCGKDFLIENLSRVIPKICNISSIDPIKEIAKNYGYSNEDKNEKSRAFLSDLKAAFIKYNDLPFNYIVEKTNSFLNDSDNQILFVHIREPKEIEKYKNKFKQNCVTLLVKRKETNNKKYNNISDDNVEKYKYDYEFNNNGKTAIMAFILLIKKIINDVCS